MLQKLPYTVPLNFLTEALESLPNDDFRNTINEPTGRFFYDPWKIKPEYEGTIWHRILETLPIDIGEARTMNLPQAVCYQSHADLDDRYHLNISGNHGSLIDLDNCVVHKLTQDGNWYEMDAGRRHTAMNTGRESRVQLVIRKLLVDSELTEPLTVRLTSVGVSADHARFIFDDIVSPWLNKANKMGYINNFSYSPVLVKFNIEHDKLDFLKDILPTEFKIA